MSRFSSGKRLVRFPGRKTMALRICALLLVFAQFYLTHEARAADPSAAEAKQTSEPTIAESGKILGVGIGMMLKEAREKLDPLRDPEAPRDEKEKYGTRAYWKLRETEFDWIMVWANRERKIVRIRAVLREDKRKPFAEVGDLAKATTRTATSAAWAGNGDAGPIQVSAIGSDEHAVRISILAFDPALPQPSESEEPE